MRHVDQLCLLEPRHAAMHPFLLDGTEPKADDDVFHGLVKVEHVAPYERWYERFKSVLESLKSKQQQQHSPLPIIYQWQRPQPAHGAQECALTCETTTACMQRVKSLA